MTLLDQPAYMTADARPPAAPRECSRESGAHKRVFSSRQRARRAVRLLRDRGLHAYICSRGHRHIGHRSAS